MSGPEETRARLLEAAVIEFAESGFENATVRGICARAEVNLNAVKYHFEDKQGLYVAAVTHAHVVTKHAPPESTPDAPPAELLREFIGGMLQMVLSTETDSASHQLLVMRELIDPTSATEEVVRSFIKPRFTHLDAILSQLLPTQTPTIDRHLLALSVVGQCFHYKIGRQIDQMIIAPSEYRRFTQQRLTDHIFQVTMAAVEAKCRETC
jgi:AcrR family transcriptional regulator